MLPSFAAIVLIALASRATSMVHDMNLRSTDLEQNETSSSPRLFIHGTFDQFGHDSGIPNTMKQDENDLWQFDLMTELPTYFQVDIRTAENSKPFSPPDLGDFQNVTLPGYYSPVQLLRNIIHIDKSPGSPHLAYRISVNITSNQYYLSPIGSCQIQIFVYFLLGAVPIMTGFFSVWIYQFTFYSVKFNKFGITKKENILSMMNQPKIRLDRDFFETPLEAFNKPNIESLASLGGSSTAQSNIVEISRRRTILIATIEYIIEDWDIQVDNGGLGGLPQLMSKNIEDQDLVWVVPCVRGIDFPNDERAEPMTVTILGVHYYVQVQYHRLRNITYVLLNAPVFQSQTKAEPYPQHMDDISSAIYYSTWYV